MTNTLVIDTSYGSTVGVVGHEPVVETNSRTHVERLQVDIARAVCDAQLQPSDIDRIIVGVGPGPYTGLRAGIVAAKAIALANRSELLGQDVLTPQTAMADMIRSGGHESSQCPDTHVVAALTAATDIDRPVHMTLAVNDARRRQLYCTLMFNSGGLDLVSPWVAAADGAGRAVIPMDIDYPDHLLSRVHGIIASLPEDVRDRVIVDVIGHGAAKYAELWNDLANLGAVVDASLLDMGAWGLSVFEHCAVAGNSRQEAGRRSGVVEPLYLRRPDVSIPNPLKHVLNHPQARRAES